MLGPGYRHVVPVGDVGAMADALLELSKDADMRQRLGAALRARAEERFDTAAVLPALVALVRDP